MVESTWVSIGYFFYQHKKTNKKTQTFSLKDFKKETIHGIQPNMFR